MRPDKMCISDRFNDDWNKAMGSQSKVFAFLVPAWGIDFTLAPNWDGAAGSWAVTTPPQNYNWGGSYPVSYTHLDVYKRQLSKQGYLRTRCKREYVVFVFEKYHAFLGSFL